MGIAAVCVQAVAVCTEETTLLMDLAAECAKRLKESQALGIRIEPHNLAEILIALVLTTGVENQDVQLVRDSLSSMSRDRLWRATKVLEALVLAGTNMWSPIILRPLTAIAREVSQLPIRSDNIPHFAGYITMCSVLGLTDADNGKTSLRVLLDSLGVVRTALLELYRGDGYWGDRSTYLTAYAIQALSKMQQSEWYEVPAYEMHSILQHQKAELSVARTLGSANL